MDGFTNDAFEFKRRTNAIQAAAKVNASWTKNPARLRFSASGTNRRVDTGQFIPAGMAN
jgi:hypothetical protein